MHVSRRNLSAVRGGRGVHLGAGSQAAEVATRVKGTRFGGESAGPPLVSVPYAADLLFLSHLSPTLITVRPYRPYPSQSFPVEH